MKIMANGTEYEVEAPMSVSQFLKFRGYEKTLVAVEFNFSKLPREQWDDTMLDEGDNLEIVRFIGGG